MHLQFHMKSPIQFLHANKTSRIFYQILIEQVMNGSIVIAML